MAVSRLLGGGNGDSGVVSYNFKASNTVRKYEDFQLHCLHSEFEVGVKLSVAVLMECQHRPKLVNHSDKLCFEILQFFGTSEVQVRCAGIGKAYTLGAAILSSWKSLAGRAEPLWWAG